MQLGPSQQLQAEPYGALLALTVTCSKHAGAVEASGLVLHLRGYLNASTGDLLAAVVEYEARCGHRYICVDLRELASVDESGMASLRDAHRHLRAQGGCLEVQGLQLSSLAAPKLSYATALADLETGTTSLGHRPLRLVSGLTRGQGRPR